MTSPLEPTSRPNHSIHILLIEDDPGQLADAWRMLETLGYVITAIDNAEAAILCADRRVLTSF